MGTVEKVSPPPGTGNGEQPQISAVAATRTARVAGQEPGDRRPLRDHVGLAVAHEHTS